MKLKLLFASAAFLYFSGSLRAQSKTFDLTGIWINEDIPYEYHFKADSSLVFTQSGFPVFVDSYTVDFTKTPAWLDMTMSIGNRQMVTPALLEIIGENEIIIEQFPPSSNHPTEFTENTYTRVKLYRK